MKLSAVILARVLAFIETFDLDPNGSVFFPASIGGIVERFKFQKFPKTFEETDEQQGVNFLEGVWNGVTIDKLTIFQGALVIDTRSSTEVSETILHEALLWAAGKFGFHYEPKMISRKRYLSDLTFYSDAPLLVTNSALLNLAASLSNHMEKIIGERLEYHPYRIDIDFDRTNRQMPIAGLNIQRRAEVPFSENKYFSEAPLPTDIHIKLLEQFESDILATK